MKRLLLIGLLATVLLPLAAQKKERSIEIDQNAGIDIDEVFDAMGIGIVNYDLSTLRDDTYKLFFYIDEYKNGKKVERDYEYTIGDNWQPLPEDADKRKEFIKKKNLDVPRKATRWHIDKMSIYLVPKNDSISKIVIRTPRRNAIKEVRLQAVPQYYYKLIRYDFRPFAIAPLTDQQRQEIPLAIYNSFWFDPKIDICRSCYGDITASMSEDVFTLSPHYYVIGIRLDKREK